MVQGNQRERTAEGYFTPLSGGQFGSELEWRVLQDAEPELLSNNHEKGRLKAGAKAKSSFRGDMCLSTPRSSRSSSHWDYRRAFRSSRE